MGMHQVHFFKMSKLLVLTRICNVHMYPWAAWILIDATTAELYRPEIELTDTVCLAMKQVEAGTDPFRPFQLQDIIPPASTIHPNLISTVREWMTKVNPNSTIREKAGIVVVCPDDILQLTNALLF